MARSVRHIGRRFPDYGWSWPTGKLDQLLKAALLPDAEAACQHAARWLDENDIDLVSFREHRLLAAISDRFGRKLATHPAYPRLVGLQKMLWTKSRMASTIPRIARCTCSIRRARSSMTKFSLAKNCLKK